MENPHKTGNPKLDLNYLVQLEAKPAPFTPGEALFWADPHISIQMLAAHLDPETDLASRKPGTIDRSVTWIIKTLGLKAGDSVLDLGCGPGLYAAKLAARGLTVTGVDISPRSLAHARNYADEHGLSIDYRCQDYLGLTDVNRYDAVLLIFGDYCTFHPDNRKRLLGNISRALRPGGHFVLDVSTQQHREKYGAKKTWYASRGGFWRPGPHLVLEQGYDYPEEEIWLDQYIIIEETGKITVYRNWFQDYDPDSIIKELAAGGFEVQGVWGDLTGEPFSEGGEWIGLVAKQIGE
jgi:SAM-dependent methyltransferase